LLCVLRSDCITVSILGVIDCSNFGIVGLVLDSIWSLI
jgi:hypothetical protein